MSKRWLCGAGLLVLAACATASVPAAPIAGLRAGPSAEDQLRALNAMCRGDTGLTADYTKDLKRVPGMGTGGFKADTANAEAQAWFDYGLQLSHAFYHDDAIVAMRKAVEADPACATCAWGEAWTMGPTLNYGIDDEKRIKALAAADRARSLVKSGDSLTLQLTEALQARYAKSETSTEPAFGKAMKAIAESQPDNLELAVLSTHALLIPLRRDNRDGLEPALAMLEDVLKKSPNDTGAIHYYIHATEFARRPTDALPYADRLGELAPAASHLVHMPAHTFFHAGRYQDAAIVNAEAIATDAVWFDKGGDKEGFVPFYYAHNFAFGVAGAMMSGDGTLALKYADHAVNRWPDTLPNGQRNYPVSRAYVALARFNPDGALAIAAPADGDPELSAYRHYARAEALLIRGDVTGAKREAQAISRIKKAKDDPEARIARHVIDGRVAMAEGRTTRAMQAFEKAAKIQEADLADSWDPPAWWYPVRRSLAAAHLKAGDYAAAEAEARKSLDSWKQDPLALWVLGKAQAGQGRDAESAATLAEARKLWRGEFASLTADAI